ncbi:MAG: transglutaminase-like domain-containing protein, partial [Candidatus Hadarchaeota archaeon]|nr:transglutaminase-like domain-containing protein [Candidatus Hadarchaeota archaeon]
MRSMVLVLLLLLMFVAFSVPVKARAPDIYYERAKLDYSINPDWSIDVQMEFTLGNDSKFREIASVSRSIPSSSLQNVDVYDDGGNPLRHTEDELDGKTTIKVYFDGGVGPGDRLTYLITFTAPDLLTERGSKHEAWLGGLKLGPDDSRYDEYVVEVWAPPGVRLFLCQPPSARLDGENIKYETQLVPPQDFGGVYGVWYPEATYYGLTLVEEFTNSGPGAARDIQLDIELFNHTVWQFAAVASSSVPLETMYVDGENNWHGVFEVEKLEPGQSENVQIDLVLLNSTFESGANENNTGFLSDVPGELEPYLHEDEYWEVDNQLIQQRAQEVVGDENNAYLVAKEIVGFVDNYLNYKVTAGRKGAVETLTSGEGDCDCFSDLTIALSRAAGLPARLDMGWTYDGDELGGHAWVEFYLPNHGWVPADPLWARNSGDYIGRFDPVHVLRGVRGLRSGGG